MNPNTKEIVNRVIALQKNRLTDIKRNFQKNTMTLSNLQKEKKKLEMYRETLLEKKKKIQEQTKQLVDKTYNLEIPIIDINQEMIKLTQNLKILQEEKEILEIEYNFKYQNFDSEKHETIKNLQEEQKTIQTNIENSIRKIDNLKIEKERLTLDTQEKINVIEIEIDKLLFEFKTYGNLRFINRNINIYNIINFKKKHQETLAQKKKLENSLEDNKKKIKLLDDIHQEEYHNLLEKHNNKLNELRGTPDFNYEFLKCKEVENNILKIKNIKTKKLDRQHNLLIEELKELDKSIEKLKLHNIQQLEKHPETLQNIKNNKKIIKEHQNKLKLACLHLENRIKRVQQYIMELQDKDKILLQKIDINQNKNYHNKSLIHSILEKNVEIQKINQTIRYYQEEKTNTIQIIQKKIEMDHSEIEIYKLDLDNLEIELKEVDNKIFHFLQQEKIMNFKYRKHNEKHLKDTNQKILQELNTLSNFIT